MSIQVRKQRQLEERRENILATAKNIARQEGWQAVSIRRIADVIEYSTPVIYGHFESKDDILFEVSKEGFCLLNQRMKEALATTKTPEEGLIAISKAHFNFAFEKPEIYQVMFGLKGAFCQKHGGIGSEGKQVLLELFEQLKSNANTPIEEIIDFWWSFMTGFIAMNLRKMPNETSLRQLEENLKRLSKGF